MSAEIRQWMDEIEKALIPHNINFDDISDEDLSSMIRNDLSVEQAVQKVLSDSKSIPTEREDKIKLIVEKWDLYNNSAGLLLASNELQLMINELKDALNDN
jgi:hypothetical protein